MGRWVVPVDRPERVSLVRSIWGRESQRRAASRSSPDIRSSIRATAMIPGISPTVAGIGVSLAAGLVATAGLWRLAVRLSDDRTADRTVVLFAFLPSAFVLSMVYADALFLALAVWCLIALLDERWLAAGIAAAAAGLVRPTAVALCAACAWGAIVAIRSGGSWRALVRARTRAVGIAPVPRLPMDPHGAGPRVLRRGGPRVGESRRCRPHEHPGRAPSRRRRAADVLRGDPRGRRAEGSASASGSSSAGAPRGSSSCTCPS